MSQFMLFLYHPDARALWRLTPAEMQARVAEYSAWTSKLAAAGKLVGGRKMGNEGGRIVEMKDGRCNITEGPYAETKEVIGGIIEIKASDYDEALSLVRDCPHLKYGSRIEIRQIDDAA